MTAKDSSGLAEKACTVYIEEVHHNYVVKDQLWVHVLPFHTAVIRGHLEFVRAVIEGVKHEKALLFFLNARITNGKEAAVSKSSRAAEYAYLDVIEKKLTCQEIGQLDDCIKLRHSSKYTNRLVWENGQVIEFSMLRTLALASGNTDVLAELISKGMDVTGVDQQENNIFHDAVKLAAMNPKSAENYLDLALECVPDIVTRKKLLYDINRKGHRPVELAFKQCVPELMVRILNLDGVYRHLVSECLFYRYVRYDVSHYEGKGCVIQKSLLYYLTEVSEEYLKRAHSCGLLRSEPIRSWIDVMIRTRKAHLGHFFAYWICFLLVFFFQLFIYITHGSKGFASFLYIILVLLATYNIIAEVGLVKVAAKEIWDSMSLGWHSKRKPVTFTAGYRLLQVTFCLLIVFNSPAGLNDGVFCDGPNRVATMLVLMAFLACLSLLFFLQFFSGIGQILVILQKMLLEAFVFVAMIGFLLFSFALVFYLGYNINEDRLCNTTVTVEGDGNNMATFNMSMYNTILYALAVVPPVDITFNSSLVAGFLVVLYILLILLFNVIALNILIAIMTNRISSIGLIIDELFHLERLSLVCYVILRRNSTIISFTVKNLNKMWEKTFGRIKAPAGLVALKKKLCRKWELFVTAFIKPKLHRARLQKEKDGSVFLDIFEIVLENDSWESNMSSKFNTQ